MIQKIAKSIYTKTIFAFSFILLIMAAVTVSIILLTHAPSITRMVSNLMLDRVEMLRMLVEENGLSSDEAIERLGKRFISEAVLDPDTIQSLITAQEATLLSNGETILKADAGILAVPTALTSLNGEIIWIKLNPDNIFTQLTRILRLIFFIPMLVGLALVLLMIGFLLNPVRKLTIAAEKVADANFDVRVVEKGSGELAQLTKTFNSMVRQLSEKEYLHKNFVSSVSHEFKTPITSLKGYAKMLKSAGLTEEKRAEYLDIIIEEGERLSNLSSNLLRLAELDNEGMQLHRKPFSLSEQIRKTVVLLQNEWESKEIDLSCEIEEVTYCGDEALLAQVWINLLANAISFTPVRNAIQITVRKEKQICVSICDHGIGIAQDDIAKIFSRFYKAEASRNKKGSGLGLPIAKRIVEIHGGSITVASEVGKGSCFSVWL